MCLIWTAQVDTGRQEPASACHTRDGCMFLNPAWCAGWLQSLASLVCVQCLTTPPPFYRCSADLAAPQAVSTSSTLEVQQTGHRLTVSCWILAPHRPPYPCPGKPSMRLSQPTSPSNAVLCNIPPSPTPTEQTALEPLLGVWKGCASTVQSFMSIRKHQPVVAAAAAFNVNGQCSPTPPCPAVCFCHGAACGLEVSAT